MTNHICECTNLVFNLKGRFNNHMGQTLHIHDLTKESVIQYMLDVASDCIEIEFNDEGKVATLTTTDGKVFSVKDENAAVNHQVEVLKRDGILEVTDDNT